MAGQRRLNCHVGGLQVTDFADHDDVRILPHQGANAFGKAHADVGQNLHLVEGGFDHFDRVFQRAHIDFGRGQLLERRIQRHRLAAAGRPGNQDNAVGMRRHVAPSGHFLVTKTEF